jgi:glycyl-tRNA synthetase beta chain
MPDFLLEIGLEEIPARMIDGAEQELHRRLADLLTRESLADSPQIERYSTPRRLAVLAREVRDRQADAEEQMKGPSVQVAYKDGQPTVAATKFAEKAGVDVAKLERIKDAKGEYISARVTRKGRTAEQILSEALPKEINALYWAKIMYWRVGKPERFVRPVRWMVAMLGGKVVPLEYGGVKAGKKSRGHRLIGGQGQNGSHEGHEGFTKGTANEVMIQEPTSYAANLKDAGVFVRREERFALIRSALDKATRQIPGARWREDASLLQTVVDLTEFPGVILGNFDPEFLALPEEVLVTVMRDHQKYFAVEDASGKLAPHFLAVLNIDSDPQGIVQHGHERVLRARFSDARFFWDTDQKHPLRERVEWLKNVTFQKDLGSYYDKTMRVQRLASLICTVLNDDDKKLVRDGVVHKAALLAKTDLTTELVKEFTELQGIVGGLYAKAQGLDAAIGDAIYDQYKPESMEDEVPRTIEGAVLSIADKADSIAGMFMVGQQPTGSKDPFALRRQGNAIIRILGQHELKISVHKILSMARDSYGGSKAENFMRAQPAEIAFKRIETSPNAPSWQMPIRLGTVLDYEGILALSLYRFVGERLEFYLRDSLGFPYDVVNATLNAGYARGDDVVLDLVRRCDAGRQIKTSPDFAPLFEAFKRIKNIVRQGRERGFEVGSFDPAFRTEFEANFWTKVQDLAQNYMPYRRAGNYVGAFAELAKLREPIASYFENVRVMVEDDIKARTARLGMLNYLEETFNTILDLAEIVPEGLRIDEK